MRSERLPHRPILPVWNAKLPGGVFNDAGQGRVMGVAHKRAQMMGDVVVEAAREPAYQRALRRIVGRCRKNMIDTVIELAAAGGEIRAVDGVRGLEYQRYR